MRTNRFIPATLMLMALATGSFAIAARIAIKDSCPAPSPTATSTSQSPTPTDTQTTANPTPTDTQTTTQPTPTDTPSSESASPSSSPSTALESLHAIVDPLLARVTGSPSASPSTSPTSVPALKPGRARPPRQAERMHGRSLDRRRSNNGRVRNTLHHLGRAAVQRGSGRRRNGHRLASYTASWDGNETCGTTLSDTAVAHVRPGIAFNSSADGVPAGEPVTFSGRVVPEHPGATVQLEILKGSTGEWTRVGSDTLDARSSYSIDYRRAATGYLVFRLAFATQDEDHSWNVSRRLRVDWI